ncbi:hypothetical protein BU24DRAFT_420248 [Aaosphaeria arxii CBS 175.79]|uniref:Uncharacterized protein n=1 Tax=Aaosphaeria arxii CBS 175.79 TaxID=1450172 RepID=A0A6A5XVH3_9PLEO|nr:uncharacterized protein BU24DRAFT_420248 [Aaosphaeria arxii CBS 175.79]KAF2017212.1 hypothetical protein BU24DRAFT_420248 [Aaosphaeria arxii CBS 175.79]
MQISSVLVAAAFCRYVHATCQSYWDGAAPWCEGSCPATHVAKQTSDCGDGSCCWSGHKVWCECKSSDSFCQNFWSGTAPFCNGECPVGFTAAGTSKTGNGGVCVTGSKVLCVRPDCRPACVPGQISFDCFLGVFGICDNGCQKYTCGACLSGGGGPSTPPPDVPQWPNFSAAQTRAFLNSRFLDVQHGLNLESLSEQELQDLIKQHWNDKSFHSIRNNGTVNFPLPISDIPRGDTPPMGEIEGFGFCN